MNSLKPDAFFAEHYQLIKLVDTGGFAEVWKAYFAGEIVALKIFPRLNEEGVEKVRAEYAQSKLLHTHLIVPSHYGVYENQPYLVMKFCEGGNAGDRIKKSDEADLAKCLFHVSSALAYLHYKDYVHQDIKPNNILLDEVGDYYLTDLGLSIKLRQMVRRFTQGMKQGESENSRNSNSIGITPSCYRAPELDPHSSASKPPIKATDVWALGATIFEIATGDVPFGDAGGMFQRINPIPPDLPPNFSPGLNGIIRCCLSKEPWERPKASELEEWAGYYHKYGEWAVGATTTQKIAPPPVSVHPVLPPQQPPTSNQGYFESTILEDRHTPVGKAAAPAKPGEEQYRVNDKPDRKKSILFFLSILMLAGIAWGVYAYTHPKNLDPVNPIRPTPVVQDDDSDGVPNDKDSCKNTSRGAKVDVHGCPLPAPPVDSDGDGIPDDIDKCPQTPRGEKVDKHGCPLTYPIPKPNKISDADGDGTPDYKDKCPGAPGPKFNNGCPTN